MSASSDLTSVQEVVRYEVQTFFLADSWCNCWTEDEEPLTFATHAEAQQALTEFLGEIADAVAAGEIAGAYCADDYRVVIVSNA